MGIVIIIIIIIIIIVMVIVIIIIIIIIIICIYLPQCWSSGCEEKEGTGPDAVSSNGPVPSKVLALGDLHPLQEFMERMNYFPQPNLRKQKTPRKNVTQVLPKENIPKRVSFRLPTCWSTKSPGRPRAI